MEAVLKEGANVVVVSPPNTGKSYAAIRAAYVQYVETGVPFVFAADTQALVDDLLSTHEGVLPDLQGFHGKRRAEPDPARPVITTYDSVWRFADSMAGAPLIVDEWHSMVTAYGYRRRAIRSMVETFQSFRHVVGLTGTEAFLTGNYQTVEVRQERPPIVVHPVNFSNVLSAVVKEITDNPALTHYVSVFARTGFPDKLRAALGLSDMAPDDIRVFNSETSSEPWAEEFKRSNFLPAGTRVVIGTFTQGFSVSDSGFMVHVVPDRAKQSALDIAQVVQRFREKGALRRINLYHTFPEGGFGRVVRTKTYKEELYREAQRQRQVLWEGAKQPGEPSPPALSGVGGEPLRAMLVYYRDKVLQAGMDEDKRGLLQDDLSTDQLQVEFRAYENDCANAYLSWVEMDAQLRRFGLRLGTPVECDDELDGLDDLRVPPGEDSAGVYGAKVQEVWDSDRLDRGDLVEGRLAYLRRYYSREEARDLALEYRTKPRWRLLARRIDVARAKTGEAQRLAAEVRAAFPEGSAFTSQEIGRRLRAVYRRFPMLVTSRDPGKSTLEAFVSLSGRTTERRGTPGRMKPVSVYRVESTPPLRFVPRYQLGALFAGKTPRASA